MDFATIDPRHLPETAGESRARSRKIITKLSVWSILLPLALNTAILLRLGNKIVPFVDQNVYLSQAENIAEGKGLMTSFDHLDGFVHGSEYTSFWGAGSQLLYAAELRSLGPNYRLMRLVSILLFGGTLWYTRRLFLLWLSPMVADVATLAVGCSPYFAIFNQLFMTEMPFLFCQQAFVFHLFQASRRQSVLHAIVAGLLFGASVTIRAVLVPILPVAALLLFMNYRDRRTASPAGAKKWSLRPGLAGGFVLATFLVAAPYCIANSSAVGGWFPLGGKGAYNLWFFNSDVDNRPFFQEDFLQEPPHPDWSHLDEKHRADLVGNIANNWIVNHPAKFGRLALIKGFTFLNPIPKHMPSGGLLKVALAIYSGIVLAAFTIALPTLSVRNKEHAFVLLLFLMYLGIDMVFMPASRHRMLYDPFFMLVGAFGAETYFKKAITAYAQPAKLGSQTLAQVGESATLLRDP